jgi:4-oxalocrotonate tautomerase
VTKTGNGEASVSVSIEDIAPKDWAEKVYKPDIVGRPETLYKEPGYGLADLK